MLTTTTQIYFTSFFFARIYIYIYMVCMCGGGGGGGGGLVVWWKRKLNLLLGLMR
jgi:hypothetical protein